MFYGVGLTVEEKSKIFICCPLPSTLFRLFLLTTRISFLSVLRQCHFIFRPPFLLISFQQFHLSSLRSRNVYTFYKWMIVSMISGNFFKSLWVYGITNACILDSANKMAPTCMPPLALIGKRSTNVPAVTMLLTMHFLSWTLVGCELHVFRS